MNKKRIVAFTAAVSTLVVGAMPASAEMVKRDAQNNLYIADLTPGSVVDISFDGTSRTRNVQANKCGVVRVTPSLAYSSATKISLGGTESMIGDLPVRTPGTCRSVNSTYSITDGPTETRFKDAIGSIYFTGLTASSNQVVSYPGLPIGKPTRANACGFIRLANSTANPITNSTSFKVGSNSYTVSSLQTLLSPACRKVSDTQSVMMVPLTQAGSWVNGS